eukprot:g15072.t1
MVSRDSNNALRQHQLEEGTQAEEEKHERSGSESSSDAPSASSSYSIMNNTFRVDSRYTALKAIGKGSFGFVCSAVDEKQGKRVAIKKIHPMAQHVVDAKHVLREIRLLRYLGSHPNIVSLEDLFISEHYDELYIVMELLDSDLHRIIQSPQALGDAHHRYFMFQLLKGVKFLHHNRIIHRDLKPGNVLVTKNCQLRITDFGLARLRPMGTGAGPDDEVGEAMTEHVVTRWYRPPELMLCPDGLYGYAVDLWSVGCIFAELLGRQPLFPGKNFLDQLTLIFDVVGSPKPHEVKHIRNSQARRFLDSMKDRVKVPYSEVFSDASEHAIDLLEGLLVFHPPDRLSVDEALNHPYFQPLRKSDTNSEPEVEPGFQFDFESKPLCKVKLKQMILEEVESFQRVQRKRDRRARAAAAANPSSTMMGEASPSCAGSTNSKDSGSGGGGGGTSTSTSGAPAAKPTASGASSVTTATTAAASPAERARHHHDCHHHGHQDAASSAAAAAAEEQFQEQQQWLRRSRRQAVAAAAASSSMYCDSGGQVAGERERAPISAVHSSSMQAMSEAATVRSGLGSFKGPSRHSHWGDGSSGKGHDGTNRGSHPHVPPPDTKYGRGGGYNSRAGAPCAAKPMDDEERDSSTRTLPYGDVDGGRSPIHPPPTQEYQVRGSGYVGLAGQRTNDGTNSSGGGRQPMQHLKQQQQPQPRQNGNSNAKWPHSTAAAAATATTGMGMGVESLQSPVRIRRSAIAHPTSATAATGSKRQGQQRGSTNRGGGPRWGLGSRRSSTIGGANGHQYQQQQQQPPDPYHHEQAHLQQQHDPYQQHGVKGDAWSAKATGLRDVEDRFHQMKFDRARNGGHGVHRSHDSEMPDPTAGMRAPKR